MSATLLIADDDHTIRTVLGKALTRHGFRVRTTAYAATLWDWASNGQGDLIITDVMMPDGDGLELVPSLKRLRPELKIIVISAQNSLTTSVKAREAGVFSYLPKPFDLKELVAVVNSALSEKVAPAVTAAANHANKSDFPLVGSSTAMQTLFRQMGKLIASDAPVLLTGETGTGKTLAANALQGETGSSAAVRENIDELDPDEQSVLLKELDEASNVGQRLISTASSRIYDDLKSGAFRRDLFERLSVVVLDLPPLRKRSEDIPALLEHFQNRLDTKLLFSPQAIEKLKNETLPGNVRQLENLVWRLSLTGGEALGDNGQTTVNESEIERALGAQDHSILNVVQPDDMDRIVEVWLSRHLATSDLNGSKGDLHGKLVKQFEKPLLEQVLASCGNNQIKAANLLGLNRNTLRKKISELGIDLARKS